MLNERARNEAFPFASSAALTYRCNLRCVHCYARTSADPETELNTLGWKRILDQLAESGCLFLLITGGEPLMRPDFAELYRHARSLGIVVTVFTNGTLITDEILDLFQAYPPRNVDITLYGASETTTRAITGRVGVFDACQDGIQKLLGRGIRVGLKTVVMILNQHEVGTMEAMADAFGVPFRLDASVFPRFDGDQEPIQYRLTPREVAELEFSSAKRAADWTAHYERRRHELGGGQLYRCAAGRTHAHINPRGELQPCITTPHIRVPLAGMTFPDAWGLLKESLRQRHAKPDSACIHCDKHVLCGHCPGFCRLETGDEQGMSRFLCELGQERSKRIHYGTL